MIRLVIPLVCLLCILTSCDTAPNHSLADADLEYFESFWPNIAEGWNNGDKEPYIKGHENSIYMVPNSQTLSNATDIRSFVESFPECTMEYSDFDIKGNQGLVGVRANFLLNAPNGELMDKGKFITLFERAESGDWDMTHAIWNSDLPVAVQDENSVEEDGQD